MCSIALSCCALKTLFSCPFWKLYINNGIQVINARVKVLGADHASGGRGRTVNHLVLPKGEIEGVLGAALATDDILYL